MKPYPRARIRRVLGPVPGDIQPRGSLEPDPPRLRPHQVSEHVPELLRPFTQLVDVGAEHDVDGVVLDLLWHRRPDSLVPLCHPLRILLARVLEFEVLFAPFLGQVHAVDQVGEVADALPFQQRLGKQMQLWIREVLLGTVFKVLWNAIEAPVDGRNKVEVEERPVVV